MRPEDICIEHWPEPKRGCSYPHPTKLLHFAVSCLSTFLNFMVAKPGKKRVVNHVVLGLNLYNDGRPVRYRFIDLNTGETKETSNYCEAIVTMLPAVPDSVESGDNSFNQLVDTPTP